MNTSWLNTSRVKRILCFVLLLSTTRTAIAEDITIFVTGNERTRSSYIENIANDYLARNQINRAADVKVKELKDLIVDKELFSEVDVNIVGNRINIKVKDRWTLIPIPMAIAQSGQDTKFGLFVLETNLFGYGKTGVLGGLFSQSQSNFFAMYKDPEVAFTDWMFGAYFSSSQKIEYLYDGEENIFGDNRNINGAGLSLGYAFSEKIKSDLNITIADVDYKTLNNYPEPEDYKTSSAGLNLDWDDATFRYYYKEGWIGHFEMQRQFWRDDDTPESYQLRLQVSGEKNVFLEHVLQVQISGAYQDGGDERDLMRVGAKRGFRGIPDSGAWVDKYMTAAFDYQIPLWRSRIGTWTVAPFFDVGYLDQPTSNGREKISYTALGIGTYLYLRKLAIPGVGVQVGHNDTYQDTFFEVTIGFSI
jgi:outer membrane protein assembly factor BamA